MKKALLLSMLAISVAGIGQLYAEDIGISAITSPEAGTEINPLVPFTVTALVKNYDGYPMEPDNFNVNVLFEGKVVQTVLRRNLKNIPIDGTHEIEIEVLLGNVSGTSGSLCLETDYFRDKNTENNTSPECLTLNLDEDRNFDVEIMNIVMKRPENVSDGAKVKGGDVIYEFDFEYHNRGTITLPVGTNVKLLPDMASVKKNPLSYPLTKELKPGEFEKFTYKSITGVNIAPFPDQQGAIFNLCFNIVHDFDVNEENNQICWKLEVDGSVNSGLTEAEMNQIEVYAQPQGLTVDLDGLEGQETMQMRVINLQGQVVHAQTVSYGQLTQVGLSPDLQHHMLIVALESRGSRFVKKVIIP